jgi:hypothetical protein
VETVDERRPLVDLFPRPAHLGRRPVRARLPLQHIFGTAALSLTQLAIIAPFPVIVWGAAELVRWVRRRAGRHRFPNRPLPQPAD